MRIPGLVHLKRALLIMLLVMPEAQSFAAQRQQLSATANAQTRGQGAGGQAASPESPFDRTIGSHLAEWIKAGSSGKARRAQKATASDQNGGIRVNAPTFVAAPYVALPPDTANFVYATVAADFNNDGKIDVVVAREDGTLDVMLNPGSFSSIASTPFVTPNTSEAKNNPSIEALYTADLNGDSYPDLIGMDLVNTQIVVWIGKGDGTFKDAVTYNALPSNGIGWNQGGGGSITVADFNKDGLPDVAVLSAYNPPNQAITVLSVQTFLNSGDGTLVAGKEADTTFQDAYDFPYAGADVISSDGTSVTAIATPIYDRAAANATHQGSSVLVLTSKGDGTFSTPVEPVAPLLPYALVNVLKATSLTTNVGVASAGRRRKAASAGAGGTGVATTDLVVAGGDGTVYDIPYKAGSGNPTQAKVLIGAPLYEGAGEVGLTAPAGPNTIYPVTHDSNFILDDFDGDGYMDALVLTNGAAYMFPNGGNAAFSGAPSQLVGPGGSTFVAADFDGDGYQSILWADSELDQLAYLHNMGAADSSQAGTFNAAATVSGTGTYKDASYNVVGSNIQVVLSADVNGDGLLDIIGSDTSSAYLTGNATQPIVLGMNNGLGPIHNEKNGFTYTTFLSSEDLTNLVGGGYVLQPLTIKNGANTSIVVSGVFSTAIYVATVNAKGTVATPVALTYAAAAPACPVNYADSGDINGDGIPDIAIGYSGDSFCGGSGGALTSGIFTFLGNADGTYQPGQYMPLGSSIYKVKLMNLSGNSGVMDLVAIDSYTSSSRFGGASTGVYNVFVLPGDGHGNFGTPVNVAPNYIASDVIAGDFNSDGIPDLTIATEGQYSAATQLVPNTSGILQLAGLGGYNFAPGILADQEHYPATAVYADVNGDGTPDLVVSEFTGIDQLYIPQLQIYPNLGGGALSSVYTESMPPYPYAFVARSLFKAAPVFVGNFGSGSASDLLAQGIFVPAIFLNQGQPKLSLTASTSTATQNTAVTLTATLTQGGAAITTANGAVSFSVGGTALGSVSLSNGVASLTTTSLQVGNDAVVASYTGDADAISPTATTNVTITALSPTFALTSQNGTLSLAQGATGSIVLNLAANATFNGTVSFTCAGAPTESTCTVSPTSLSLSALQTGNATVVIATTAKNNQYQATNQLGLKGISGGASLAGLLFLIVPRRRRNRTMAIFGLILMVSLGSLAVLTGLSGLTGCGSGGSRYPGTPAGNSTLTITATSGSITQSQTINLTVTSSGQ